MLRSDSGGGLAWSDSLAGCPMLSGLMVLVAGRSRSIQSGGDGKPGEEVQLDFGYLGMISDGDRRRRLHALVFTAVFSRYCLAVRLRH